MIYKGEGKELFQKGSPNTKKKKSAATALNIVLASAHIQMT
jgi:hypothetical protein